MVDNLEIDKFIKHLDESHEKANKQIKGAERLPIILHSKRFYTEGFLKLGQSFNHILLRADAYGYSIKEKDFGNLVIKILKEGKRSLSGDIHAWEHYVHLTEWLIYLGSTVEIRGTILEKVYLESVEYSFSNMSDVYFGYYWKSHFVGLSGFNNLLRGNRDLILDMVNDTKFFRHNDVDLIINSINN